LKVHLKVKINCVKTHNVKKYIILAFIPILQAMLPKFKGNLFERPDINLMTNEGAPAV